MIFRNVNIEQKLLKLKDRQEMESHILAEVHTILTNYSQQKNDIEAELNSKNSSDLNGFKLDLLKTSDIYHLNQIKKICIDYRLRFLDSHYFKGTIPQKTVSKIKKLETSHNIKIKGFKIVAPSKLFKLEDKDDPLLFAPIGNGYFYLIDKWGNDLHPFRKLLVWPFKNIVNLLFFTLSISYFTTLLIPEGLFSKNNSIAEFWILYFFMFKSIAAVIIFYGFAQGKNFNPVIWNSKYFNS
ncbi:hypothetical protein [Flagellimonas pacifica]|uniref:Uncharacterized protein n=1 Tax=Flagellimonas pacifica TaxID=1247520 RepID=A0A285MU33_9FLAO|nr:hypothetical protein [Allomuricauda parva]SNZ00710.1 hypothetical protein SAMN06265377_2536 [Allomuricauda parva]